MRSDVKKYLWRIVLLWATGAATLLGWIEALTSEPDTGPYAFVYTILFILVLRWKVPAPVAEEENGDTE